MTGVIETRIGGQTPTPSGHKSKRALRWAVGIVASLALALWTVGKWNDWQQFQADLISYKDVAIGQTKTEVQYAVGAPQTVQGPEVEASDGWTIASPLRVDLHEENSAIPEGYDPLPKGKTAMDYDDWHYWNSEGTFDVTFDAKSGRVESVSCWQPHESPGPCAAIFGVGQFTSEDTVVRLLGAPDKEEVSGGEMIMGMPMQVSKSMDYNALGLHLLLTKKEVDRITKRAPQGAGLTWWIRHRLF